MRIALSWMNGWTATDSTATAADLDSTSVTRWATGAPQANGQWFQVDLGATKAGPLIGDYPRQYQVQVYVNNAWITVGSGWAEFRRADLGNGTFALQALINNAYVSADLNSGAPMLIANRDAVGGAWAAFMFAPAAP